MCLVCDLELVSARIGPLTRLAVSYYQMSAKFSAFVTTTLRKAKFWLLLKFVLERKLLFDIAFPVRKGSFETGHT